MAGLRHPFTGATYSRMDDGHILVTNADGRTGVFQRNGKWISGEVRECDAQLCGWVGGPRVGNHRLTPAVNAATSS